MVEAPILKLAIYVCIVVLLNNYRLGLPCQASIDPFHSQWNPFFRHLDSMYSLNFLGFLGTIRVCYYCLLSREKVSYSQASTSNLECLYETESERLLLFQTI